jgi:hypothetical protein
VPLAAAAVPAVAAVVRGVELERIVRADAASEVRVDVLFAPLPQWALRIACYCSHWRKGYKLRKTSLLFCFSFPTIKIDHCERRSSFTYFELPVATSSHRT